MVSLRARTLPTCVSFRRSIPIDIFKPPPQPVTIPGKVTTLSLCSLLPRPGPTTRWRDRKRSADTGDPARSLTAPNTRWLWREIVLLPTQTGTSYWPSGRPARDSIAAPRKSESAAEPAGTLGGMRARPPHFPLFKKRDPAHHEWWLVLHALFATARAPPVRSKAATMATELVFIAGSSLRRIQVPFC